MRLVLPQLHARWHQSAPYAVWHMRTNVQKTVESGTHPHSLLGHPRIHAHGCHRDMWDRVRCMPSSPWTVSHQRLTRERIKVHYKG